MAPITSDWVACPLLAAFNLFGCTTRAVFSPCNVRTLRSMHGTTNDVANFLMNSSSAGCHDSGDST